MSARPYQVLAEDAVIEGYDQGWKQQIVSMATGTGKTWVFSNLYAKLKSRLPGQMLVLAHTEELVDQNIKTIQLVNPELKVDKEMAKHKADPSTADVVVASVASLGRKGTSRILKYDWDHVDKVIIDECHHTPASSYLNILGAADIVRPDTKKLLLGVTATTQRTDGKALSAIYRKITYVYGMREAIQDGWLVDIRGYRVRTTTDISDIATTEGDFKKNELADCVNNAVRNQQIVDAWKSMAGDRKTLVFGASVEHAQALAGCFQENGIAAEAVWGEDPDRAEKITDHKTGKIRVLLNYGVFTEGYDDPSIECIIIARPTKSELLFTQMCGRGTRLAYGKHDCIIIDVVDIARHHSLCTVPTLLGLSSELNLQGHSLLESVKAIEAMQETYPGVDFTKLTDVDKMKWFIEQIDMFAVRFPEEVENNSKLKWLKAIDSGYRVTVPKNKHLAASKLGWVTIRQNLLDKWEINGMIKNRKIHGTRISIEEAFQAADHAIKERAPEMLVLMNRKASWHDKPATPPQMNLLKKLYPGRTFPELTSGQAAFQIDQRLAKKAHS